MAWGRVAAIMRRLDLLPSLHGLDPPHFLGRHWQRKPLFLQGAIDPRALALEPAALRGWSMRDDVESRLIRKRRGRWIVEHGPLSAWPRGTERGWTVLVQGANTLDPRVDRVLDRFRWLPHARIDDIMISYAAPGGGVGPHLDSYDVFLVQAEGRRRWRIGPVPEPRWLEGAPIKLLRDFEPTEEFVCEPGDILYLPPGYGHDGIALDACTTWSVGFRAPSHQELARDFLTMFAHGVELEGRFADPGMPFTRRPARVPDGMVDALADALERVRWTRDDLALHVGESLSEPKPATVFHPPARPLSRAAFARRIARDGLVLDAATRLLHDRRRVFVNGEALDASGADGRFLRALADRRRARPVVCADCPTATLEALYGWYREGWLRPGPPTPRDPRP